MRIQPHIPPRWLTKAIDEGRVTSVGVNPAAVANLLCGGGCPLRFEVPYPPTVNTYWRHVIVNGRVRVLISKRGREYRRQVYRALLAAGVYKERTLMAPLVVTVSYLPPDRKKRDLDNLAKALLDALTHCGVYADDSQVRELNQKFGPVTPGGRAEVEVKEIG